MRLKSPTVTLGVLTFLAGCTHEDVTKPIRAPGAAEQVLNHEGWQRFIRELPNAFGGRPNPTLFTLTLNDPDPDTRGLAGFGLLPCTAGVGEVCINLDGLFSADPPPELLPGIGFPAGLDVTQLGSVDPCSLPQFNCDDLVEAFSGLTDFGIDPEQKMAFDVILETSPFVMGAGATVAPLSDVDPVFTTQYSGGWDAVMGLMGSLFSSGSVWLAHGQEVNNIEYCEDNDLACVGPHMRVSLALQDPLEGTLSCKCAETVYKYMFHPCAEVCVNEDIECNIDTTVKVSSIGVGLGFIPSEEKPAEPDWTANLFLGAIDFPLSEMFTIHASVVEFPNNWGGQVNMTIHECNSGSMIITDLCDGIASCDQLMEHAAQVNLNATLQDEVANVLAPLVDTFFNYDGAGFRAGPRSDCATLASLATPACALYLQDDLLPGILTYHKYTWFYGMFGPMGPVDDFAPVTEITTYVPGQAISGDGVVDQYDPSGDYAVAIKANLDADGDSVPITVDLCPDDRDWTNNDEDGDGIGDACDKCRLDNDPDNGDPDDDGVCNTADPKLDLPADNCPLTPNADQHNANETEEWHFTPDRLWGDRCDPVPVPYFEPQPAIAAEKLGAGGSYLKRRTIISDNSTLDITALGSSRAESGWPGPAFLPVERVPTDFRFCNDPTSAEREYRDPCTVPMYFLNEWAHVAPSAAEETSRHPYHRVTVVPVPSAYPPEEHTIPRLRGETSYWYPQPAAETRDDSEILHYGNQSPTLPGAASYRYQWLYEHDYWFWKDAGLLDFIADPCGTLTREECTEELDKLVTEGLDASFFNLGPDGLSGMLWVHANTPVGDTVDLGTGTHGPNLSNMHLPFAPSSVTEDMVWKGPSWVTPIEKEWEWPEDPGWKYNGRLSFDPSIVYFDPEAGVLGQSAQSKFPRVMNGISAGVLASLAADNVLWFSQSEPYSTRTTSNPVFAVGLTADATALNDLAIVDRGNISTMHDIRAGGYEVEPGYVRPFASLEARRLSASAPEDAYPGLPSARQDFRGVYSRSLNRLFVVGGTNEDGQYAGDIWSAAPGGAFTPLTEQGVLNDVVAATYVPEANAIFVIDEVSTGFFSMMSTARLLKVDADSGEVEEQAQWMRFGLFDAYYLTADRDGSLLLTASSKARNRHMFVGLDPETARPNAMAFRKGALHRGPIVRSDRYEIVRFKNKNRKRTVVKSKKRLFRKSERHLGEHLDSLSSCVYGG